MNQSYFSSTYTHQTLMTGDWILQLLFTINSLFKTRNQGQLLLFHQMFHRFIFVNLLVILAVQAYFDDVLYDIQNQNRFNPYMFAPPPIFHVCQWITSKKIVSFYLIFYVQGWTTYSIWICKRYKLSCYCTRFFLSKIYQCISWDTLCSATT